MPEDDMVVCVSEKPNNLTSRQAIGLIGQYFSKEWKYLREHDVKTKRLQ